MKKRITAALVAKYPTLKPYQIEKSVSRYITVMLDAIAESIRKFGFKNDQISLSLDAIAKASGKISIDGKKFKVSVLLNSDRNTSLVYVEFPGQVGQVARVSLNPIYQADIESALMESRSSKSISCNNKIATSIATTVDASAADADVTPVELHEKKSCSANDEKVPNITTTVDPLMLDSFIENTRRQHAKAIQENLSDKEKYRKKLLRNYLNAEHIRASLTEVDGEYLFSEFWEQSDSGRCYGHGTSLQRVSKHVRHAALGRCHMYDVKAASYALMTGLALEIDPALDVAVLVDYVSRRSRIRKDIAADVGVEEDKIKEIFTSLGFGAKTANNPFASIRKTLGESAYNRLMMNDQFVRIGDAMNMVREVIAGHYSDSFDFYGRHYESVCPRTGEKRKKDQKLAWIYQVMESEAITRFGADAADAGYQPLLFVHDCVYFKQKLPQAVLAKITNDLQQTFPLLETDYEAIYPIHTADFVDPIYAQEAKRIDEHNALMQRLSGDVIHKVTQQPEVSPWHDEFADLMSMNDAPDFSKLMAGGSNGNGIDLGHSWSMAVR